MNLQRVFRETALHLFVFLSLFVFSLTPLLASAQETGNNTQTSGTGREGGSFTGVIGTTVGSFLNNPVTTTGNLIQSGLNGTGNVITNVISGIDSFVQHPIATTGTVIRSGLNTIGTTVNGVISGAVAFVDHPIATIGSAGNAILNNAIDMYVATGNEAGWWSNTSVGGTTFGNPIEAIIGTGQAVIETVVVDPVVGIVNWLTGGVNGENPSTGSMYTQGLGPSVIPAGGYVEVTTNPETGENYTTVYDENGNAVRSNDPRYNQRNSSGSGGASIPGASRGTVGNPFSTGDSDTTGANSDETGTNNVETQTNPYLFEYDPNSTNNNPAGSGAQTQ